MAAWLLLGIGFLSTGIFYLAYELRYINREKRLKFVSFFRLMYSLTFGLVPAVLCFAYGAFGIKFALKTLIIMDYSEESLFCLFVFWLLSIIFYFIFNLAYKTAGERAVRINYGNRRLSKKMHLSENQIFCIALFCFFVGCISLYIWTIDLGGVFEFIPLASGIRGDYLNTYGNTHTAWRQPARICLPASYLFFFLAINKNNKHKIRNVIMAVISVFVALLFLLCNDGRMTIAFYFAVLLIGFVTKASINIKNTKKAIVGICIVAICCGILLSKLDDITYFFRHWEFRPEELSGNKSVFDSLMEEFLFVYKSGITSVQVHFFGDGGLKILSDLFVGLTALIPSRFLPSGLITMWRYNTILCTGSTSPTMAIIPCDIVSLSIYDLGIIGVILIPLIVGAAISLLEGHFKDKPQDSYHLTMYYGLVLAFLRLPSYASLNDFLLGIFPYLLIYLIAHGVVLLSGTSRKKIIFNRF
ncbi:MAG: hypothetical protein ACI4F2_09820 [Acutalibacteraceae bacterium]